MAPSVDLESEQRVRAAAFAELRERVARFGPDLPWHVIRAPFHVGGEEILFANRPRGIFKPRQLSAALSIKTTEPRSGRARRYDDLASDEAFIYRYQGVDSQNADNLALRRAFENGLPLIYFYATSTRSRRASTARGGLRTSRAWMTARFHARSSFPTRSRSSVSRRPIRPAGGSSGATPRLR